jgi:predicted RNase H-like HicB family nuclease
LLRNRVKPKDPGGRSIGDEAMSQRYAVIFEQAESSSAAYVPDLPGCITTGKTLEETEQNIREAIQGHLQTLREFGESVPRPTSRLARASGLLGLPSGLD